MAYRIYKYTLTQDHVSHALDNDGSVTLSMPKGAKVLGIKTINMKVRILAIINTKADEEDRTFHVFATGQDLPEIPQMGKALAGWFGPDTAVSYHGTFSREGKTFHLMELPAAE